MNFLLKSRGILCLMFMAFMFLTLDICISAETEKKENKSIKNFTVISSTGQIEYKDKNPETLKLKMKKKQFQKENFTRKKVKQQKASRKARRKAQKQFEKLKSENLRIEKRKEKKNKKELEKRKERVDAFAKKIDEKKKAEKINKQEKSSLESQENLNKDKSIKKTTNTREDRIKQLKKIKEKMEMKTNKTSKTLKKEIVPKKNIQKKTRQRKRVHISKSAKKQTPERLFKIAQQYEKKGEKNKAVLIYKKIAKEFPNSEYSEKSCSKLQTITGKNTQKISEDSIIKDEKLDVDKMFKEAIEYEKNGNYKKAKYLYKMLLKKCKDSKLINGIKIRLKNLKLSESKIKQKPKGKIKVTQKKLQSAKEKAIEMRKTKEKENGNKK